MKTIRILYFVSIFLFTQFISLSQESAYYDNIQKEIDVAKELFDRGKYISTFNQFEKIQEKVDQQSELFSEAEYFKSVSALKAGYSAGSKMLTSFTDNYPESPYINSAWFNLGNYQFDKNNTKLTIKTNTKVNTPN